MGALHPRRLYLYFAADRSRRRSNGVKNMRDKRQLGIFIPGLMQDAMLKLAVPQVARMIGYKEEHLPFFSRTLGRVLEDPNAYRSVQIPKRLGGYRTLDIPNHDLMRLQRRIHSFILVQRYTPSPICHSFVGKLYDRSEIPEKRWRAGRSIFTNAFAHLAPGPRARRNVRIPSAILTVDLKDAYPSIAADRVFRVYQELTGDPWTAQIFTHLSVWRGCLPQGAPTSPMLQNLVYRELDVALAAEFNKEPLRLTRYADDFTLTSLRGYIDPKIVIRFIEVVESHGFPVNRQKVFRWRRKDRRLRVTGVNILRTAEHPFSLPRKKLEQLRAALFYAVKTLESATRYEADRRAAGTLDITTAKAIDQLRKQTWGRIHGAVGFAVQVYGDELPRVLYKWFGFLREKTGITGAELLQQIRESFPASEIQRSGRELLGDSP